MKKIYLILIILISTKLFSVDIVNIWEDNSSQDLGVSYERTWIKSYFLSNFQYYETLPTEDNRGQLTVVTISRDLYFKLENLLKFEDYYIQGDVTISKKDNIYRLEDKNNLIDISFSLEKPSNQILFIINKVYKDDEKTRKLVTDHYLNTWVIRIHSGENIVSPDIKTLDFNDVLISATIIGEKFQWLWGVHDGADYLSYILE